MYRSLIRCWHMGVDLTVLQARQESGEERRRVGESLSEVGSKGSDSPRRGRRRGGEEASSTSSHEDRKPSRDSACDSPDPQAGPGAKEQSGERQAGGQRLDSASPSRESEATRPVKVQLLNNFQDAQPIDERRSADLRSYAHAF